MHKACVKCGKKVCYLKYMLRFLLCFYNINMSIEKHKAANSDMDTYIQ